MHMVKKNKLPSKKVLLVEIVLWTRTMQFRHSCEFFLLKSIFSCAQRPKTLNKIVYYPAWSFFLKMFRGHEKIPLNNAAKKIMLHSEFFYAQSPEKMNKIFSPANWFFLKVYPGHKKWKIMKSLETFSLMYNFFSARYTKKRSRTVFLSTNWFSGKVFPGHDKCSSANAAAVFSIKSDFFLLKCEIHQKFYKTFKKTVFRPHVPLDTENAVLTLLLIIFPLKSKLSSAQISNKGPNCTHRSKNIFRQAVCWTQELQFC